MALVLLGQSQCPLCRGVLESEDGVFATSGFPVSDPALEPFMDAGMHNACFMAWPMREQFIREFNEYYEAHYRGMRFMNENGSIEEREPTAGRVL